MTQSVSSAGAAAAVSPYPRKQAAWPVWALRVFVTLELAALLLQTVTAGGMIEGSAALHSLHGSGSMFVHLFALLQVVAAILVWRPGRRAWWPAVASLVVLLAGFVQTMLGGSGSIFAHVPVGATLIVLTTWLGAWAWTRNAGDGR